MSVIIVTMLELVLCTFSSLLVCVLKILSILKKKIVNASWVKKKKKKFNNFFIRIQYSIIN